MEIILFRYCSFILSEIKNKIYISIYKIYSINKIIKVISLIFIVFNIIFSLINKINKKFICLCVIGKGENLYAKEYINHYKNLGYNHIFIYDNNDIIGERFSDILQSEIKNGFVSIIDFIGYKRNTDSTQVEAYYDCYKRNHKYYNWLSFYDFDEYLELKPKNITIQEFLNNIRYKNCQNIKINWLVYNSNNETLYYENKPLQIRFDKAFYNLASNMHIKSTVRGGINKNYWSKWTNPHSSLIKFRSCSSSGEFVNSQTPFIDPPDYKYAFIKHYYKKSFEEFCLKIKRGWPDLTDKDYIKNILIKENRNNTIKIKIIKSVFNSSSV